MNCCRGSLECSLVAFRNLSFPFPSGVPIQALLRVPGPLHILSASSSCYHSEPYIPSPCFSHAILEVEKGAYLDLDASFQDDWSNGERRTVESVRREHWADTFGNDRGNARVKLRRDNIL